MATRSPTCRCGSRASGTPRSAPAAEISEVSSQDDGSYVIGNLVPGRYRVVAQFFQEDEWTAGAESRESYVPTYYPNATDSAAAAPVEMGPGAEVRGLNIRLARIPVYRVRGRVVDAATGEPAANASLHLIRAGEEGAATRGVTVGSDGTFSIPPAAPGRLLDSVFERHRCDRHRP